MEGKYERIETLTMMFATGHSVTSNASFASPLLTVDEHPSLR
jgi:hypothetical protein